MGKEGGRPEDAMLRPLKTEEGATSQECRWPPKAGKGKEMDSSLKPPEGK